MTSNNIQREMDFHAEMNSRPNEKFSLLSTDKKIWPKILIRVKIIQKDSSTLILVILP